MSIRDSRPHVTSLSNLSLVLIVVVAILASVLSNTGERLAISPVAFAHPRLAMLTAATTELLADGGFEQSPSAWKMYSRGGYSPIATAIPHGGASHFYGCGYPNCDDRVWQAITLPATLNSATVSFWVASTPAPFNLSSVCRDGLSLVLEAPDTTILATLWTQCHSTLGYTLVAIDVRAALLSYVGKQVLLALRGTTANLTSATRAYSFWFVDDVSLSVS